jgi:hypothetical protein
MIDPGTSVATPKTSRGYASPDAGILPHVFDITGRFGYGDWIVGGLSAEVLNIKTGVFKSSMNPSTAFNDLGPTNIGVSLSEFRDGYTFTMQADGALFCRMSVADFSFAYYSLNTDRPSGNLWTQMTDRTVAMFMHRAYVYGKMPDGKVHVFEFDLDSGGYDEGRVTDLGVLQYGDAVFSGFVQEQ